MANEWQNDAERIAGRAYGVMFFAGFGSLWMLVGLGAMHLLDLTAGAAIAALLVLLVLSARCLHRRAKAERAVGPLTAREAAEKNRIQRTFTRVNGAQYFGMALVIVGMNLLHRPEWIAPGNAIVVGLHLLPLARPFRNPTHYATGVALIAYAVFCMAVLPRAEVFSRSALGAGTILLVSAAGTLLKSRATLNARTSMQLA